MPCWCAPTASLLALLLGTFLAYSISRFNVGGKYFRHTILTIRMIPPIVVAISILIYYAIIIPYVDDGAVRRARQPVRHLHRARS